MAEPKADCRIDLEARHEDFRALWGKFLIMMKSTRREQLVTVVMPSLNQARFIERAIDSVLSQQGAVVELIIMDGGSSDGTQDMLRKLSQEESGRLRWISEEDRGPAHAINKAISIAKGEILGWLNADDLYTPGAIERALNILDANPHWQMVYGHGYHIDANDQIIDRYPTRRPEVPIQTFADGCFICQPSAFLRKTAAIELGDLDENLRAAFDFEWWLRLFSRYPDRVGFVDAFQAHSRLHEDCITIDQREIVVRESMQIVARYFGTCPLHWFKSYAHEVFEKSQHAEEKSELQTHVREFADSIRPFLSKADQHEITRWLRQELLMAQTPQENSIRGQAKFVKLVSGLRLILKFNSRADRAHKLLNKQIAMIKSSGLFDEAWYLSNYKDVSRVGIDPVEHYLKYGGREGRNPSKIFNTISYLESNPEVVKLGMNPLVHFLIYGKTDADRANHHE